MTDAEANKAQNSEDLPSLQSKLNELRLKKEEWFNKKEELKLRIAELINQIKGLKSKSDSFGGSISKVKSERDKYNAEVRNLISQLKKLNEEKKERLAKLKVKVDPSFIKSQISKLETRIETEALSFDQEKKVMKQINSLKKQMAEAKDVSGIFDRLNELSKRIDEAKKKAEEFHSKLVGRLSENKQGYGEFMDLSKKINELKATQEDAFNNFTKYKKEFSEISNLIKGKLGERQSERKVNAKKREDHKKAKEESDKQKLKEKVEEVEEKLKTKKVLTTEDLIAFQGADQ